MTTHRGAMPPGLPHGEPEDCGRFCVWWYTQPVRGGTDERLWAWAPRAPYPDLVAWRMGDGESGFLTRDGAVRAARKAVAP